MADEQLTGSRDVMAEIERARQLSGERSDQFLDRLSKTPGPAQPSTFYGAGGGSGGGSTSHYEDLLKYLPPDMVTALFMGRLRTDAMLQPWQQTASNRAAEVLKALGARNWRTAARDANPGMGGQGSKPAMISGGMGGMSQDPFERARAWKEKQEIERDKERARAMENKRFALEEMLGKGGLNLQRDQLGMQQERQRFDMQRQLDKWGMLQRVLGQYL